MAVSPENELRKCHWWKGFALFGGKPRTLWLATWSPISIPGALECPENLSDWKTGRRGEKDRVSLKEKIRETYNMGAWGVWSPLGKGY